MRVVSDAGSELGKAVFVTREEARAAFGNPALYLEKFLEHPRVTSKSKFSATRTATAYGSAIGIVRCNGATRKSSRSRRRRASHDRRSRRSERDASRRAVGSVIAASEPSSSCTKTAPSSFVEMNTRLQVEHPVTEMTSGVDIVQQQIAVAWGDPLTLKQKRYPILVDTRSNAASTPRIPETFAPNRRVGSRPGSRRPAMAIRFDTRTLHEGYVVPPYYDSLIGKLIVHADSRDQALSKMEQALADLTVEGIKTNVPLLREIITAPAVRQGGMDVHYLEKRLAHR